MVVFDVALPIFSIIGLGYIGGRTLIRPAAAAPLNLFVYWFALPPVLFNGLASQELATILNGNFIAVFLGAALAVYLVAAVVGRLVYRQPPGVPTLLGLNASFTNTGYMGIPLFLAAYGTGGVLPAVIGTVLTSVVLMGLGIVGLEWSRNSSGGRWRALGKVGGALARNPLILSSAAGILWTGAALPMPAGLSTFCEQLGGAAGPTALFALGLFLAGQPLTFDGRAIMWLAALKLFAQPALAWLLASTLFPLDPAWHSAVVLLAALPTGTLPFVLAQRYRLHEVGTSQTILATTLLSLPILSLLLAFLPRVQAP